MMKKQNKQWWMSKTIWSAFVALILAIISSLGVVIPQEVYVALAALGLYGLRTAKTDVKLPKK
jgi:hypothetical protein